MMQAEGFIDTARSILRSRARCSEYKVPPEVPFHVEAIIKLHWRIKLKHRKEKRHSSAFGSVFPASLQPCCVHVRHVKLCGEQWWETMNTHGEESVATRTHFKKP